MAKKIDTLINELINAVYADGRRVLGENPEIAQRMLDAKNAIKSQFREAADKIVMYRNNLNAAEGKIRELMPPVKAQLYEPFDASKVKPGDEIQVQDDHGPFVGVWRKAKFVAVTSRGLVISEHPDGYVASAHESSRVRVVKKTKELQLFVNVIRNPSPGHAKGFVYSTQPDAISAVTAVSYIAVAEPVTITVVE